MKHINFSNFGKIFFPVAYFMVTFIQVSYPQPVSIYTPKGEELTGEIHTDNPDWVAYWEDTASNYLAWKGWGQDLVQRIGPATYTYNCHGYAWHSSEGNSNKWIKATLSGGAPNLSKYWTGEESYILTESIANGRKVRYYDTDHSAITTTTNNYFKSKWGPWPLYYHRWDKCPYYEDYEPFYTLYYYELNPSMTGSTSILCNNVQREFTTDITHMPSGTLDWVKGSNLIYVSGQGTPTYKVKGSGYGSSYVRLNINTQSGFTWSDTKNFWVGIPDYQYLQVRDYYTKQTNPNLCLYDDNYLEVFMSGGAATQQGVDYWGWNLISGGYLYAPDYPYDVAIATPTSAYFSFQYRAHNTCGWSSYMNNTLNAYYCGYFYSYSPNPVNDELKIEAVTDSGVKTSDLGNNIPVEFEAFLYNSDKQIVKKGISENSKLIFNVSELKHGIYFLHIIDLAGNYDLIKEQIIIN